MRQREVKALRVILGEQLRYLREASGKRQEDLAVAARQCGFRWTQATVAAIESGRRTIEPEEMLGLPLILYKAKIRKQNEGKEHRLVELPDLLSQEEWIAINPRYEIHGQALREILHGRFGEGRLGHHNAPFLREMRRKLAPLMKGAKRQAEELGAIFRVLWPEAKGKEQEAIYTNAQEAQDGDAEQKASRKLGVSSFAIAAAAHKVWGHSLTEERDRQVAEQTTADTPPRTIQALRGHISRSLLTQLQPLVEKLKQRKEI
jgi:transcriptional regulator with XRE-family HTH domain